MERFKMNYIGSDKIPVTTVVETLEELKMLIFNYAYIFDETTPNEYKTIASTRNHFDYAKYYRGHSKTSYRLESTLERYLKSAFKGQINIEKDYERVQEEYLKYCKEILLNQSIDGYVSLPRDLSDDDIWAFGQHYQLKTPLLDWTKSFFVALFFAFENQEPKDEKYRVIYELNEFFNVGERIIVEPKIKIGNRVNAQKGVFTKMSSEQLEALGEMGTRLGEDIFLHRLSKILISSELRKDVLSYLASINIDSSTMYPDLLGRIKNCELGIDNAIAEINLGYED